MLGQSTLDKHRRIVTLMTEALGIDPEHARQNGLWPREEMDAAVLTCTRCARSEACAAWLMDFGHRQDATPAYCRNRARFAALKDYQ